MAKTIGIEERQYCNAAILGLRAPIASQVSHNAKHKFEGAITKPWNVHNHHLSEGAIVDEGVQGVVIDEPINCLIYHLTPEYHSLVLRGNERHC